MQTNYFLVITSSLLLAGCSGTTPLYRDATAPTEKRINDLLGRMTLEEKAAQMDMLSAPDVMIDKLTVDEDKLAHFIDSMSIGSIHDLYPETASLANSIQRRAVENTRLGIPLLFIEEGLHGYCGAGSTNFPVPLGSATGWDTTLMYNIGRVIGTEARAHGVHFLLCPNLDLLREPRWGRTEETYGEDVYLNSRMAVNMVKGMQGASLKDADAVAAEPKHFGVHGIPENGSNTGSVYIGEREARSTHLYVFEKAVREGHARGIMAAYHDIDGIPCISSDWLLTELLRDEWGFDGMVVTDLGAIRRLEQPHYTASSPKDAIVQAVTAGLDMQFYDYNHETFQTAVVEAVKDGTLSREKLDHAVAAVLRIKFELGLFENPYTDENLISKVFHNEKHKQLALEAGRKSIVLLKNDNHILPLKKELRKVVLLGSLADVSSIGGYGPREARGVTVYEALKERLGEERVELFRAVISKHFVTIGTPSIATGTRKGVYVEYFNNPEFAGKPSYTAVEEKLQGYWHNLSPAPGINADHFSVRYTAVLTAPESGEYEFSLTSDDMACLYIGDRLLIDNRRSSRDFALSRPRTASMTLRQGESLPVRVEYIEEAGDASVDIRWRLKQETESANYVRQLKQSLSDADAVIAVIGETNQQVGEGHDRQDLNFPSEEIELLTTLAETGKPVVSILLNGRPLVTTPIANKSGALVEAWFPGEAGGAAIADVLLGDYNPSGRLTVSIPRYQGQLPVYYSRKPASPRNYTDGNGVPLYSFGHGLSYSLFEYSNLKISPSEPTVKDVITVSVDVRNSSAVAGTETVQLYVRDVIASVGTPVMALKGFSQVFLKPDETKTVTMEIVPAEHLWLINKEMKRVVEPGEFEFMIGKSSSNIVFREKVRLK
jgi:beta-glucosidase